MDWTLLGLLAAAAVLAFTAGVLAAGLKAPLRTRVPDGQPDPIRDACGKAAGEAKPRRP